MTLSESKQALARKLDIDYSDIANNGLFTDSDLVALIQFAVEKAWDFKPWPFTQHTETATTIAATDYYDHPQDLMSGSIGYLTVAGKEYTKLSMAAYLDYLQCNATGTDRIWAERELYIFINKNAYAGGVDTFDLYGKAYPPSLGSTDELPFSPITDSSEHSGNDAIVQLAYAEALSSEKKKNAEQGAAERKEAYETLSLLWKPFADAVARQNQTGRPMFNVPALFPGSSASSQSPIGNFNL